MSGHAPTSGISLASGSCVRLSRQITTVVFRAMILAHRIWYAGAYTVKLNLLSNYFGAILVDRGDRFHGPETAHPAQAASLIALATTIL